MIASGAAPMRHGIKGRQMRWVICAVFVVGFVPHVFAADLDILRGSESVGPPSYPNWSGFYFGGHWGYSDTNADFSQSTPPPVTYQLPGTAEVLTNHLNLPVLGVANQSDMTYGGFVGYDSQWEDLVLGIEGNFSHAAGTLNAPTATPLRAAASDGAGNTYTTVFSTTGTLTNLNYAELRGRVGLILGSFLPYGFLGPVVGLADVNLSTNVTGTCNAGSTPTCTGFSFTATTGRNPAIIYGGAIGGGVDYAITPNVFLRGEFEYVRFLWFDQVMVTVASARVGAGIKF
jgi:outer membrane immunogenic protein